MPVKYKPTKLNRYLFNTFCKVKDKIDDMFYHIEEFMWVGEW